MKAKQEARERPRMLDVLINSGLLVAVIVLGLLSLFASLEIVLTVGAQVVIRTNDSAVRSKYALVTLRNIWLLVGGIIWLVIIIASIDRFMKHWRERRTSRVYLAILAIELVVIAVQYAVTA
jgi:hypothetical protein